MSYELFTTRILNHPDVHSFEKKNSRSGEDSGKIRHVIKSNIPRELFKNKVLEEAKKVGAFTFADMDQGSTAIKGSLVHISDGARSTIVSIQYKDKPGGGQSGAGSDITDHGESWQAICLAARYKKGSALIDAPDVLKNLNASKTDAIDAEKCIAKLSGSGWLESGIAIANHSTSLSISAHHFHWQSDVVDKIYDQFKIAQRVSGFSVGNDKWNPADIWAFKEPSTFKNKLKAMEPKIKEMGLSALNEFMLKSFESKEALGISLKKNEGTPVSLKTVNKNHQYDLNVEFDGFKNHKMDKVNTLDVFVLFKLNGQPGGEIQFRNFGSSTGHQGNITKSPGASKAAVHGKLGAYEQFLTPMITNKSDFVPKGTNNAQQINAKKEKFISRLEEYIHHFDKSKTVDKIIYALEQYQGFLHSKFYGMQIAYYMDHMTPAQKKKLTTQWVAYGMSQIPDVSCVHYKYQ